MTWSIIAKDTATNALGVAVASRFFAVGALVSHVRSGVGAICSQALLNPYLGIHGIRLMEQGVGIGIALDTLIAADEGRAARQVHGLDRHGETVSYTGAECIEWAGHAAGDGVCVAGNMLASRKVVDDTLAAYEQNRARPLAERLLRAMHAGERAGGDKRGRQAAGLVVVGAEDYADLDIRVDDHQQPIAELWRLYEVAHERHLAFRRCMPKKSLPAGIHDRARLDASIEAEIERQGRVDFSEFWR